MRRSFFSSPNSTPLLVFFLGLVGSWVLLLPLQSVGVAALSRVMELSFEDFDDNNVPVYDGPGDFISLAFYSTWDLRVSKMQRPACMFRARLTLFFLFLSFFFEIK